MEVLSIINGYKFSIMKPSKDAFYFIVGDLLTYSLYRYITIINVTASIITLLQGIMQSIFIVDGLQRYAKTKEQATRKPGRGIITFLIVANVISWVYKTLMPKKTVVQDEADFYGSPAWPIILNISLPLLLFFRFHSSICLAEMWHSAYETEEHKDIVKEEVLN